MYVELSWQRCTTLAGMNVSLSMSTYLTKFYHLNTSIVRSEGSEIVTLSYFHCPSNGIILINLITATLSPEKLIWLSDQNSKWRRRRRVWKVSAFLWGPFTFSLGWGKWKSPSSIQHSALFSWGKMGESSLGEKTLWKHLKRKAFLLRRVKGFFFLMIFWLFFTSLNNIDCAFCK